MSYVVIDLEWNQAMSSQSSVFNKLPIRLRGEIIEIGAVKLNDDLSVGEEFTIDVKPIYFRRMHYKVKKITGFDKDRLAKGVSFPVAMTRLREWCGDDVTFLTWGCDDQGIMEQNIIIHDLDWDWIREWANLQLIYNVQTGGDKNQKSLASAMEHFAIEQTRVAHDALGDAYNTALVSTHLDMIHGLQDYANAPKILASRMASNKAPATSPASAETAETLDYSVSEGYTSKADAFASEAISQLACPVCNGTTGAGKWVNQGDNRYMNIFSCEDDGDYLVRVKFHKDPNVEQWSATRLVYHADSESVEHYRAKLLQAKRRGRKHSVRKNRPA